MSRNRNISNVARKTIIARKARLDCNGNQIEKGDKIREQTWFTYTPGGKRTGYHHVYTLIAKAA